MTQRLKIGIVGGGVAGLTAAWLLHKRHDVHLFERNAYIGGHTNTVDIPSGPDAGTAVDTGFIVLNDRNYPLLHKLLDALKVSWRWSDMSFSYWEPETGFCYAGTDLNGMFAQRSNLLRPSFYRFLLAVGAFCKTARIRLQGAIDPQLSLGDYLRQERTPDAVIDQFIVPMTAAIWSASREESLAYPARPLLQFWENHGLLSFKDRPRWQTVAGGSRSYVIAMLKDIGSLSHAKRPAVRIERLSTGAQVQLADGATERFDRLIIATHADEALALLGDPSPQEARLLGAWHYARNRTVLHTDIRQLPVNRRAWASWNYARERDQADRTPVSVSYAMNRLQGLRTREEYIVTLNPVRPIDESRIVAEFQYDHPQFTREAMATQPDLPSLNGQRGTYFCGSYFGHGFHEDACRSGVEVARQLGAEF